jgi:hypothetical protein
MLINMLPMCFVVFYHGTKIKGSKMRDGNFDYRGGNKGYINVPAVLFE